jgi:competence ComEA-like helix-hairpin-helix protein
MKPNNAFLLKNLERNGILAIFFLIVFCLFAQKVVFSYNSKSSAKRFAQALKSDSLTLIKIRNNLDSGTIIQKKEKFNYPKKNAFDGYSAKNKNKTYVPYTKFQSKKIEINTAGQLEWEMLPGIGPVLAQRIVKLKEALGGYYKIEQIAEVYGVEKETYDKIKENLTCNSKKVTKISFNTATLEELERHPYISQKLAKQIINYRTNIALFKSKEDTKQLYEMTPASFERLNSYIGI